MRSSATSEYSQRLYLFGVGEDIAYLERFLVAEQILQVAELEIGIEQKRFDASFLCEQCAHGSDGALSCAATSAHDAYDVRTFDLRDDLLCGGFLRCSNGRYGAAWGFACWWCEVLSWRNG